MSTSDLLRFLRFLHAFGIITSEFIILLKEWCFILKNRSIRHKKGELIAIFKKINIYHYIKKKSLCSRQVCKCTKIACEKNCSKL